jgi:hypothetical protein
MTPLNDHQKQLLFDYSFGLTSDRENDEAEALIAASDEAVELYQSVQSALAPLDALEPEPCPDDLTELLFTRLGQMAPAGRLGRLLAAEQSAQRIIRVPLWRNWSEVAAAAAAVVLFVSVLFPTIGHMRGRSWQTRCGSQLGGIYSGLRSYVSDHDGLMPAVAMAPGSPWWKVGYQGRENHSNTRQAWLLVSQGYVDPSLFLCPGRPEGRKLSFDGFKIQSFNDFPSRTYIHFSIRIPCPNSRDRDLMQKRVLLADRNPLSEMLPSDLSDLPELQLCEKLITSNSRNHRARGQNALLYDGSVEFARARRTSISDDDIYLVRGMSCGTPIRGDEFPASDLDIFLAP